MAGNLGRVHFSTGDLPGSERLPYWREQFARGFLGIDFEPRDEALFSGEATIYQLPGMSALSSRSSPARMVRSRAMIAAADEHFGFAFNTNRQSALLEQRGRQLQLRPGDAVSISHLDPATFHCAGGGHIGLVFPIGAPYSARQPGAPIAQTISAGGIARGPGACRRRSSRRRPCSRPRRDGARRDGGRRRGCAGRPPRRPPSWRQGRHSRVSRQPRSVGGQCCAKAGFIAASRASALRDRGHDLFAVRSRRAPGMRLSPSRRPALCTAHGHGHRVCRRIRRSLLLQPQLPAAIS